MELLVVIAIIGVLAALTLPNIKGFTQSNVMNGATRQVLDDLALARQRAISERTTVYVLFSPPLDPAVNPPASFSYLNPFPAQKELLLTRQYNSYALYAERSVGDQPGVENWHPRYLTDWRTLPEGVFFAKQKFFGVPSDVRIQKFNYYQFYYPDPQLSPGKLSFPFIAFSPQGGLDSEKMVGGVSTDNMAVIPLARGSYFLNRDVNGYVWGPADPVESPPDNSITNYNHIVIDGLTGRARVERVQIQ